MYKAERASFSPPKTKKGTRVYIRRPYVAVKRLLESSDESRFHHEFEVLHRLRDKPNVIKLVEVVR